MNPFTNFHTVYSNLHQHDGELYQLRHKLAVKSKDFTVEDAKEMANKFANMERRYQNVCNMLLQAYPEMAKLEAENEFMLRLINEHAIGE